MPDAPEPKPSGTVAVLRHATDALEVLLLQRAARDGKPGAWVFPGGKVETHDRLAGAPAVEDARRAAIRETREESGLALDRDPLTLVSRWITPEIRPKRFDAWFFLAEVPPDAPVRVDGEEMGGHRWLRPAEALAAHHAGEIPLAPPTYITIHWLQEFASVPSARETLAARDLITFRPHICPAESGACILYPGDAGYDAFAPDTPGERHRLWADPAGWRYEWTGA